MSLQASWNSAIGIIGGLSRLKKISDEQKKTNETLNEQEAREVQRLAREDQASDWVRGDFQGPLTDQQYRSLANNPVVRRDEENEEIEWDHEHTVAAEQAAYEQEAAENRENERNVQARRWTVGRFQGPLTPEQATEAGRFMTSGAASRINNQMAAQRAQEHIQQADTPRNSGVSAQEILRRASTFGRGGDY